MTGRCLATLRDGRPYQWTDVKELIADEETP
jgi:hypothetical protein